MKTDTKWKAESYYYEGEVRVTYEKLPPKDKPLVDCSCTSDPSTVRFADKDIAATSTLTAAVAQKGSLRVKEWKLYGRLADCTQLQTQTLGALDKVTYKFSFNIPKAKMIDGDTYTETYVMRAIIYFTDGSSVEDVIECSTVITRPGATPQPSPGSTPEPTLKPRPVMKINADWSPGSIFTGETSTLDAMGENFNDWTWTFSDNLDPKIIDKRGLQYPQLKFDEPGAYTAVIKATNEYGDEKSATAILYVNDPKPVAVISGVTRWIQGRPLPAPHHLNNSYTPLSSKGVTIDHSKSEKKYKKNDDAYYTVAPYPAVAPMELGNYTLAGKVYDSEGRESEWATYPLEIVADEPPTVEIFASETGIRKSDLLLIINAQSPDGDIITRLSVEERYDQNNDGNFEDEAWKVIYNGVYKESVNVRYNTLGHRQYRATVTEDYGLTGTSNIAHTEIINLAPEADFTANGITQQPDQGEESTVPVLHYSPQSILRSWTLKRPYVGGAENKAGWKVDGNSLKTRNAVWASFDKPYNLAANLKKQPFWEIPAKPVGMYGWTVPGTASQVYPGYRMILHYTGSYNSYNQDESDGYLVEVDARTGKQLAEHRIPGRYSTNLLDYDNSGEKFYSYFDNNLYLLNLDGQVLDVYPQFMVHGQDKSVSGGWGGPGLQFKFSKDKKTLYMAYGVTTKESNVYSQRRSIYVIKYSLTQKTLLWSTIIYQDDRELTLTNVRGIAENDNGDVFVTYQYAPVMFSKQAYMNGFAALNANGIIKNSYQGPIGGISPPAVSDDGQYVYMSGVNAHNQFSDMYLYYFGLFVYNNVTNQFYLSQTDSHTASGPYVSPTIYQNPVVRRDGTVYSPAYGTFTKTGVRIAGIDFLNYNVGNDPTDPPEALPNEFEINKSSYGANAYLQAFEQPNGKLVRMENWIRWQKGNNSGKYYTPFFALANGTDVTSYLGEKTNQYYYNHDYFDGVTYFYQATTFNRASRVAPDGSIYLSATMTKFQPGSIGQIATSVIVPFTGESSGELPRLVDDNTVEIDSETWGGLLYDPNDTMRNQVLEFDVAVGGLNNDKSIGAAIQIQDEKNMYSMEWSPSKLSLFKVISGIKTELGSTTMVRASNVPYKFKLEAIAGTIRLSVNGVAKLEAADSKFVRGSAGIMSLGQQQAAFSNVKRTNYGTTVPEETFEAVLVGEQIDYKKLFNDPEADVKNAEEWTYKHDPNYFANPLGLSQYDGRTLPQTLNSLDKPGLFEITYRAQDKQPSPFGSYQLFSAPVTKSLYVHRRPIAQPNVKFTGIVYPEGEALDYLTNDTSYDPDVPDRLADRIFRTRWADQATWTTGERLLYNRPGVELIVQEQVKDLHGAWSYWGETRVYKDALPPVNQTKPRMTITVPNGTSAAPTVLITDPTVKWIYKDDQNDPQELYRLIFTYVDNGKQAFYTQGIGDDVTYEVPTGTIDEGRVVKIHGYVYSNGVWSDASNSVYFILDLPPVTQLLSFNGPKASEPVYTNNNRPELRVRVTDPENHPIASIDYEVFYNSTGTQVIDTNALTAATSYRPPAGLQEGLHHWRARANDGYLWGPYSTNGYFFVDTVRPDDVDEQLDIKPTSVTVKWNAFRDAQPSSGHAARTFYMQKVNPDRSVTAIDLNGDGTPEYSLPLSKTTNSYQVKGLVPGQEYRLTVIDYDVAGNEGQYAYIYFKTNSPPTGDFKWSPDPVFEGDTVRFYSIVSDPDRDDLDVVYELTSPQGVKKTFSYVLGYPYADTGPTYRMLDVGEWTIKLTVSDRLAPPVVVTKKLTVYELKLKGFVKHTPLWEQYRQAFNASKPPNDASIRPPQMFWAGEKFMLEAETTDTRTDTFAERVEVKMLRYALDLTSQNTSSTRWKGELWEESFEKLRNGTITFVFTVYYSNGIVKTDQVDIEISGTVYDYLQIHRVR
ncbi:hypothetical protein [Paenibacillus sp. NPDC058174]|uniref:hypothetical protein n=1 Tax=Paenibacillus sp. NPDC058174 TaxID=3346366 RepID=UPI0036DC73B4